MTLPTPQHLTPLEVKMPMCNAVTLDFLHKCLDKDPARRWTCDQLLRHPYFEDFSFKVDDGDGQQFARDKTRVKSLSSTTRSSQSPFRARPTRCRSLNCQNRPVRPSSTNGRTTRPITTFRRYDRGSLCCSSEACAEEKRSDPDTDLSRFATYFAVALVYFRS